MEKRKRFELKPLTTEWYYKLKIFAIIMMIPNIMLICSPLNEMFSEKALIIMRMISRVSMPIFAYELVECFHYTKSRKKHLLELFLLMIISEPLRDFVADSSFNIEKQSICYDLFLSWIMLIIMNIDFKKLFNNNLFSQSEKYIKMLSNNHKVMTGAIFCIIAEGTMANYGFLCIALIGCLEIAYSSNHKRIWQIVFFIVYILMFKETKILQIFVILDIILIIKAETKISEREENKKSKMTKIVENRAIKWICRIAYPLQLLIFSIIKLITT